MCVWGGGGYASVYVCIYVIERRRKKYTFKLTDRLIGGGREKQRRELGEGGESHMNHPPQYYVGLAMQFMVRYRPWEFAVGV